MSFTEIISHLTKEAVREINVEGSGVLRMSTEPFVLMHRPSKLYFFQAAPLVRALSPFVCHSP